MLALTTFCALLKPCGGQEKLQDHKMGQGAKSGGL